MAVTTLNEVNFKVYIGPYHLHYDWSALNLGASFSLGSATSTTGQTSGSIWSELQAVKFEQAALGREFNEMKNGERAEHDREEKRQQRSLVFWFRVATIIFLIVITSMMWWLIMAH